MIVAKKKDKAPLYIVWRKTVEGTLIFTSNVEESKI